MRPVSAAYSQTHAGNIAAQVGISDGFGPKSSPGLHSDPDPLKGISEAILALITVSTDVPKCRRLQTGTLRQ